MNKLFVRLAASSALVASMGGAALADSASISNTGPDSTNTVTSSSHSSWDQSTLNWADLSNWNHQNASSGNAEASHNTKAGGFGGGSGSAFNTNSTINDVVITNAGSSMPMGSGHHGSNMATISLTGPDSTNRISSDNSQHFNSATINHIHNTNLNDQQATSGDVTVHGNTVAGSSGGSGDASNANQTTNTIMLTNAGSGPNMMSGGSGGLNTAAIELTGPGSTNQIRSDNHSSVTQTTQNFVSTTNANHQSASSGDVNVSHNTVAGGSDGSGAAENTNFTGNTTIINN